QRLDFVARLAKSAVELDDRLRQRRRQRRQLAQILRLDALAGRQRRIGENLAQAGDDAALVILGEGLQVEIETARQLQQQHRRDRALIVLDEVEIARADLELLGELYLAQPMLAPEAPDPVAEHHLLVRGAGTLEKL